MEFFRGQIIEVVFPEIGGSIQRGKRPAIVVSNDIGNTYASILEVVPLTTATTKANLPTHMWVEANEISGLSVKSMLLAEQIITITKDMVNKELGSLTISEMEKVNKKLKISLDLN